MYKYFLILFTSFAIAQKPFSRENPHNTFAIKGVAYVNLLDGGGGFVFGLEKGFAKHHSFGIKYSYDLATPHEEDTQENDYQSINYSYNKNRSIILEYKYYFDFKFMAESNWSPYISLSNKFGTKTYENDRDYPHDFYYREEKYNLIGPSLGAIFVCGETRWTIDTQVSYLFGRKKVFTEDGSPENVSFKTDKLRFEILVVYTIDW